MRALSFARLFLLAASASCARGVATDGGPPDVPTATFDVPTFVDTAPPPSDTARPPTDVPAGYHTVETDDYTLPQIGMPGAPNPYTVTCPHGSVAVGLGGRSGAFIDQVSLLCAPLRANGTLGTSTELSAVGGPGGGAFVDPCIAGDVIVEVKGEYGLYIDSLAIGCAPLAGQVGGTATVSLHAAHGGSGGGVAYDERCDTGYVLDGIAGVYGAYVNSLNPRCVRVAP